MKDIIFKILMATLVWLNICSFHSFDKIPRDIIDLEQSTPEMISHSLVDSLFLQTANGITQLDGLPLQYDVKGVYIDSLKHIDFLFLAETDGYSCKIYMLDLGSNTRYPKMLTIFEEKYYYPNLWFQIDGNHIKLYSTHSSLLDGLDEEVGVVIIDCTSFSLEGLEFIDRAQGFEAIPNQEFKNRWDEIFLEANPNGRTPKFTSPDIYNDFLEPEQ